MESDVLLKTVEELIAVETSEIVYTLARPKIIKHRMFLNGRRVDFQLSSLLLDQSPQFQISRSPGHEIFRMGVGLCIHVHIHGQIHVRIHIITSTSMSSMSTHVAAWNDEQLGP